jgi:hypothetical protein
VNPVIELLFIILPDIFFFLFKGMAKKKIEEGIKKSIPRVKRELEGPLHKQLNEQSQVLIEAIGREFEEEINKQKEIIERTQKEIDEQNKDIEARISLYEETKKAIKARAMESLINMEEA